MSFDHLTCLHSAPRHIFYIRFQVKACAKTTRLSIDFYFEPALILINGWQQVIRGLDRPLTCKLRSTEAVAGNMESWQKLRQPFLKCCRNMRRLASTGIAWTGPAFEVTITIYFGREWPWNRDICGFKNVLYRFVWIVFNTFYIRSCFIHHQQHHNIHH